MKTIVPFGTLEKIPLESHLYQCEGTDHSFRGIPQEYWLDPRFRNILSMRKWFLFENNHKLGRSRGF